MLLDESFDEREAIFECSDFKVICLAVERPTISDIYGCSSPKSFVMSYSLITASGTTFISILRLKPYQKLIIRTQGMQLFNWHSAPRLASVLPKTKPSQKCG